MYCQSLNMCSDLYAHFLYELGDSSYYPPDVPKLCTNRLFGMYHSGTADHNKSMTDAKGIVRVVFATVALGMGVNLAALFTTVHLVAWMTISRSVVGQGGQENRHFHSILVPTRRPNVQGS